MVVHTHALAYPMLTCVKRLALVSLVLTRVGLPMHLVYVWMRYSHHHPSLENESSNPLDPKNGGRSPTLKVVVTSYVFGKSMSSYVL